ELFLTVPLVLGLRGQRASAAAVAVAAALLNRHGGNPSTVRGGAPASFARRGGGLPPPVGRLPGRHGRASRPLMRFLVLAGLVAVSGCGKADRVHKAAGNMYLRRGDLDGALREFRQAAAAAPKDPAAHTLLGDVLYEKGALDESQKEYE